MSIPAHRACTNSMTHHRLRRNGRPSRHGRNPLLRCVFRGGRMKQKTDIRARSNIPRFPWTRGALPRQATVRAHRHRSSTGIDRNTLRQCPRTTAAAPPLDEPKHRDDRRDHRIFQPHGGAKRPCPATLSMGVPSRTSAPAPALIREPWTSDHPREGAPTFRPPRQGSSTSSDHCSRAALPIESFAARAALPIEISCSQFPISDSSLWWRPECRAQHQRITSGVSGN